MEISSPLGEDVPFCIMGGTALAEDIGTVLTQLPQFLQTTVLLVKPPINVSTTWACRILSLNTAVHPDVDGFIQCLESKDYNNIYSFMKNTLESVTIPEYPVIDEIKSKMLDLGAEFSMMSGSGPTVFGFFADEKTAKQAKEYFDKKFDQVIITKTV
jgi:4-diphosphocytidyl-2-C-methyl-D-erythritol kinase